MVQIVMPNSARITNNVSSATISSRLESFDEVTFERLLVDQANNHWKSFQAVLQRSFQAVLQSKLESQQQLPCSKRSNRYKQKQIVLPSGTTVTIDASYAKISSWIQSFDRGVFLKMLKISSWLQSLDKVAFLKVLANQGQAHQNRFMRQRKPKSQQRRRRFKRSRPYKQIRMGLCTLVVLAEGTLEPIVACGDAVPTAADLMLGASEDGSAEVFYSCDEDDGPSSVIGDDSWSLIEASHDHQSGLQLVRQSNLRSQQRWWRSKRRRRYKQVRTHLCRLVGLADRTLEPNVACADAIPKAADYLLDTSEDGGAQVFYCCNEGNDPSGTEAFETSGSNSVISSCDFTKRLASYTGTSLLLQLFEKRAGLTWQQVLSRLRLHEWLILQLTCRNMAKMLPTKLVEHVAQATPWPMTIRQMQVQIMKGTCDLDTLFIYLEQTSMLSLLSQSQLLELLQVVEKYRWNARLVQRASLLLDKYLRRTVSTDIVESIALAELSVEVARHSVKFENVGPVFNADGLLVEFRKSSQSLRQLFSSAGNHSQIVSLFT